MILVILGKESGPGCGVFLSRNYFPTEIRETLQKGRKLPNFVKFCKIWQFFCQICNKKAPGFPCETPYPPGGGGCCCGWAGPELGLAAAAPRVGGLPNLKRRYLRSV